MDSARIPASVLPIDRNGCYIRHVQSDVPWLLLLVRTPSEPSRHRVAVWRELRRAGAAPVGSGAWVMPAAEPFLTELDRIRKLAVREGGSVGVIDAGPRDEAAVDALESAFARVRLDEWHEFRDDCRKFLAEIDKEFAKEKFTLGELEEEEQSLERLRRWLTTLLGRNVLRLPEADDARGRFDECERRLSEYAEQVMKVAAEADRGAPLE